MSKERALRFALLVLTGLTACFFCSAKACASNGVVPPAQNYAPNLWFSAGEEYFPTNPYIWFFENGMEIDGQRAVEKYNALSLGEKLDGLAVFYHINNLGDEWVYQYWLLYVFNDAQGLVKNKHYGDWEAVVVFVDKETKKITKAVGTGHQRKIFDTEIYEPSANHVWSLIGHGSHANCVDNDGRDRCDFFRWRWGEKWEKGVQILSDGYELTELTSELANLFGNTSVLRHSKTLGLDLGGMFRAQDNQYSVSLGGKPPVYAWKQDCYNNPQELRPYSFANLGLMGKYREVKAHVANFVNDLLGQSRFVSPGGTPRDKPGQISQNGAGGAGAPAPTRRAKPILLLPRSSNALEPGENNSAESEIQNLPPEASAAGAIENFIPLQPPEAVSAGQISQNSNPTAAKPEPVIDLGWGYDGLEPVPMPTPEAVPEKANDTDAAEATVDTTPPDAILDLLSNSGSERGEIGLSWTAPDEAAKYIIKYATSTFDWASSTEIANEIIPAQASTSESFGISELEPGQKYFFAIKSEDEAGNISELSNIADAYASAIAENIIINEVQLDSDEFIELYNPTGEDVDLSGRHWAYYSDGRDWNKPYRIKQFPEDAVITAGGYYLIALCGNIGSGKYLEPDWQPYGSCQLSGSSGSVAVLTANPKKPKLEPEEAQALVLDALGWGEAEYVYETEPANEPEKNNSLVRKNLGWDTDNNLTDFMEEEWPSPTNSLEETATFIYDDTVISDSIEWTPQRDPYILISNKDAFPTVSAEGNLTIQAGTVIKSVSKNYPSLVVQGVLNILGEEDNQVIFTSAKKEKAGQWAGIVLEGSADISNAVFEYGGHSAKYEKKNDVREMVKVIGGSLNISSSIFENSKKNALALLNAVSSSIADLMFLDNSLSGVVVSGSEVDVNSCQFTGNKSGIQITNGSFGQAQNNVFTNNTTPILLNSSYFNFSNNEVDNNGINGIVIGQESVFEQDLILGGNLPYVLESNKKKRPVVSASTTLSFEPGTIIKPQSKHYCPLEVEGRLGMQGTAEAPIIVTSFKDDEYGGDTNGDGATTTPAFGDWKDIWFNASSTGIFDNVLFRYGDGLGFETDPGANVATSSIEYGP